MRLFSKLFIIALLVSYAFGAHIASLIDNTTWRNPRIDPSTNVLGVIEFEHHEVHEGSHYTFGVYDIDLDIADTLDYVLLTPDTTAWCHLVWAVSGALTTKLELYETTLHDTVTRITTGYNNNRNSANTPGLLIWSTTADSTDGTLIDHASFGISTGVGALILSGGGTDRGGQEWILKQDTYYYIVVTTATDDNNVSLKMTWYEHENID